MRVLIFHGYLLRGHRQQHLQRQPRAGPCGAWATRSHLLCQDRSWDAPGGGDHPQPGHRAGAARVRGGHLRGLRGEDLPRADRRASSTTTSPRTWRPCAAVAGAGRGARQPSRDGARDPGAAPRRGPVRREDPRQRARVHGAARTPSASCPMRSRAFGRRGGVLVGSHHTGKLAVRGAVDEPVAAGAHAPGAARAWTSPRVPPARAATWSGWRPRPAARRGAASTAPPTCSATLDPLEGPDRQLRGQADRLEGRRPAAGGLAARGRPGARRAARDRRASAPIARASNG